jgi:hypothetical protein
MAMPATQTEWTVEMLDALPDDGQRYEVIDGELHVTPAPRELHQLVALHAYYTTSSRRTCVDRPWGAPWAPRRTCGAGIAAATGYSPTPSWCG